MRCVRNAYYQCIVCAIMGVAAGIPLGALGGVLQAWYTQSGKGLLWLGALTWIGFPYLCKWLWAPLLDLYPAPFGGRRRGWILLMQLFLAVLWWAISFLSPEASPCLLTVLATLAAFFSATQDIQVDAYRTEWMSLDDSARGTAAYVTGYRIALLLTSGGGMLVAAHWGWATVYRLVACVTSVFFILTAWCSVPLSRVSAYTLVPRASTRLLAPVYAFFSRVHAKQEAMCLLLYKLTDVFAFSLTLPFLLRGVGFTLTEIGVTYKVLSVAASILGGVWGGLYWGSMPRFSALRWGILSQAISMLGLLLLALWGRHLGLMCVAIFLESFFSGASTIPLLAWVSELSQGQFVGTQFAFLTALTSVGRVCVGPLAATYVFYFGWTTFFLFCAGMALPAWYCVYSLEKRTQIQPVSPVLPVPF